MKTLRALSALAASALLLTACGTSSPETADTAGGADAPTTGTETIASGAESLSGTVTVLAAASLTEAFTELADQLKQEHPGITVELSFGSSTSLAQQIAEGAEADVYASAGRGALDHLPEGYSTDGDAADIASNVLEIAVPKGNPGGVKGLNDFTRSDIDTVLCAETVPCGKAADEAFAKADLTPTPASREIDVKATLSKVTLGEADAAIVYQSDVATAGQDVEGIAIPADENVTMAYPMLWANTDPATITFVDLVRGPQGLAALAKAGFGAP